MAKDKNSKMESLAREILLLSRNTLLVNMRFLDIALSQFKLMANNEFDYMVDGKNLFFNPYHVLITYSVEKEIPVRDYLHMVLHCIYRHMYGTNKMRRIVWDLACDIAVEYIITGMDFNAARAEREKQQLKIYEELEDKIGTVTAEKIYRYYFDKPDSEIQNLNKLFEVDVHDFWYWSLSEIKVFYKSVGVSLIDNDTNENNGKVEEETMSIRSIYSEQELIWKDISEKMMTEIESFSKLQGDSAERWIQQLREVNREKYDYTRFLKKFAVIGEAMQINDEEFDYVYYTYGLEMYKNMPLIEPLEYKEVKRIKEFVIAIDTSGSVAGDTVQKFIQKTWNILKSTESFFNRINLHIIQCDAEIQEDVKITSQTEFDDYMKHMSIHGLGGTDFRPVFDYVEQLRKAKEFLNLKGLIYFTDGYGTFPVRMTDYQTAFVFLDDEYNNFNIPSWAIKLILRTEDI